MLLSDFAEFDGLDYDNLVLRNLYDFTAIMMREMIRNRTETIHEADCLVRSRVEGPRLPGVLVGVMYRRNAPIGIAKRVNLRQARKTFSLTKRTTNIEINIDSGKKNIG